ncbi:MAG: threonine ammonia-lyase, partial [Novosphingobium sp.]|nr:threonine ammonia-lyase [Novosphingobium sp.]
MNQTATGQTAGGKEWLNAGDVRAAARRIAGAVVRTPTLHSRTLS